MPAGSASERQGGGGVPVTQPRTPPQEEEHTSSETTPISAASPAGPAESGEVSPALSSRTSETLGSVHTDLGDISRAATKRELNLTRRALKATHASVRQALKEEEEEERKRLEEKLGGRIRTLGLQMDEDVPEMISATKTAMLNEMTVMISAAKTAMFDEMMPMIDALNERVNEMSEKITTIADSAQEALKNLRHHAGSDWSDWSLPDDSDFQSLKERVEHLERGYLVGFPN